MSSLHVEKSRSQASFLSGQMLVNPFPILAATSIEYVRALHRSLMSFSNDSFLEGKYNVLKIIILKKKVNTSYRPRTTMLLF